MQEVTVIIHGWSDSSKAFEQLKGLLVKKGLGSIKTVLYADYESREDRMTFSDIIDGLNDQFVEHGIIDRDGKQLKKINIICHSTGGLVIRHWIWRYYSKFGDRIRLCPVKRIVMLAPANFGSPLAHRGKSFFSSLVKGRRNFFDFLETGRKILGGLELASPYQWQLAHGDVIQAHPYFNAWQIQTTVLVGIQGFTGLARVANRAGSDGAVLHAGTSLDTAKLSIDFSKPRAKKDYQPYKWEIEDPDPDFAFAVLEDLHHRSIVDQASAPNSQISKLVLEALRIRTPSQFLKFQDKLEKITEVTYRKTGSPKYQQFIVHALDDSGKAIRDFTLNFFVWRNGKQKAGDALPEVKLDKKEEKYSDKIQDIVTSHFHSHQEDSSYRSFLVNLTELTETLEETRKELGAEVAFSMRMHVPKVDDGIHYDTEDMQNIVLHDTGSAGEEGLSFFFENTTTFLELKVNRCNQYVSVSEKPHKH